MKCKQTQTGTVTVLAAISMLVVVAVAGAGIDMGHSFLNKTRAQTLVDALALAAAKSLDDSAGDTDDADDKIEELFDQNMLLASNSELKDRLEIEDLIVQYSNTLTPFTPGGDDPRYVRVATASLPFQSWFIQLLGVDSRDVAASAVSGPSSTIGALQCGVAPMLACGIKGVENWGYTPGMVQKLKAGAKDGAVCDNNAVGPGNFHLIDIGDGKGGRTVRETMASGIDACEDFSDGIDTEPGNTVGPAFQGMNSRFNMYSGSIKSGDYPPDIFVTEDTWGEVPAAFTTDQTTCQAQDGDIGANGYSAVYNSYFTNTSEAIPDVYGKYYVNTGDGTEAAPWKRIVHIPIGECGANADSGKSTLTFLGIGCFFVLRPVEQGGQEAVIYAEYIEDCSGEGVTGPEVNDDPGTYKIVLYKDVSSIDS